MAKEKLPLGQRPDLRVVGDATKEERERIDNTIAALFGKFHFADLDQETYDQVKELELEKNQIDRDIIKAANDITNKLIGDGGGQPFDIPERNIHILSPEFYEGDLDHPGQKEFASTVITRQAILVNSDIKSYYLIYMDTLIHEMVHLKGYYAEEVFKKKEDGKTVRREYRYGLEVFTLAKKNARLKTKQVGYFRGLSEALISGIGHRFAREGLLMTGNPALIKFLKDYDSQSHVTLKDAYVDSREVLEYIIESVAENKKIDPEEVRRQFYKAHFTGHLVELARMIEQTFGKGSFRAIGKMSLDNESAGETMDYLKKQIKNIGKKE